MPRTARQVFWSVTPEIFHRGCRLLRRAGFQPTTRKARNRWGRMVWYADVPQAEFRRAVRFVRGNF